MKIALIGYGKMGKAIEQMALNRGHQIGLKIDVNNLDEFTQQNIAACDVAIEFTSPHTAVDNLKRLLNFNIPVVCGSTGWLSQVDDITSLCNKLNGALLYTSNFSVGVNLFFELNKKLARLMAPYKDVYTLTMEEIHHTAKKDAPSGTAITLAEQIMDNMESKMGWINHETGDGTLIPIISKREDPAPGTHIVKYSSTIDDIEIIHTAHNRMGFATGAVMAAEFLQSRKGIYNGMKEVLGL